MYLVAQSSHTYSTFSGRRVFKVETVRYLECACHSFDQTLTILPSQQIGDCYVAVTVSIDCSRSIFGANQLISLLRIHDDLFAIGTSWYVTSLDRLSLFLFNMLVSNEQSLASDVRP